MLQAHVLCHFPFWNHLIQAPREGLWTEYELTRPGSIEQLGIVTPFASSQNRINMPDSKPPNRAVSSPGWAHGVCIPDKPPMTSLNVRVLGPCAQWSQQLVRGNVRDTMSGGVREQLRSRWHRRGQKWRTNTGWELWMVNRSRHHLSFRSGLERMEDVTCPIFLPGLGRRDKASFWWRHIISQILSSSCVTADREVYEWHNCVD